MDTCALVVFSVAAESVRNRAYMRHRCIYIPVAHSDPSETGDRAHTPIQKKREISKRWILIGNSLIAVNTAIREFPIEIHFLEISFFFVWGHELYLRSLMDLSGQPVHRYIYGACRLHFWYLRLSWMLHECTRIHSCIFLFLY